MRVGQGRSQFDRSRLPSTVEYLRGRGIAVPEHGGAERRCKCPMAEHGSERPFSVNVNTGMWRCFACDVGGGDSLALHQATTDQAFPDAARDLGAWVAQDDEEAAPPTAPRPAAPAPVPRPPDPDEERRSAEKLRSAGEIWAAAVPIAGTIVERYLRGRGCRLPHPEGDVRFAPRLERFGFDGPAMICRISQATDCRIGLGLHVTWLKPDGSGRLERRYLGAKAGGVVRLWPDDLVTTGLAIAEGIETALAAAHAFTPVWASMDAGNLARFPVLAGVESLTIFADRDLSGTGQGAAADCAERWLDAGREVRVLMPDTIGSDIADEVAA